MAKLKSWQDRMNPPIPKTNKHKKKPTRRRGFSEHVHQFVCLIAINGIKPDRGEWYLCKSCRKILLMETVCEVPLGKVEDLFEKQPKNL